MEPLSIISVILQLASAAPELDKLLQNNVTRTYTRTETIEFYRSNMNTNIFEQNDKKHKKTRRASQPAFKTDALKSYVDMLIPIQERRIQALPVEEEFVFYDNIQETLMDVAARVFIGLDEKSPEAQRLSHLFSTINEGLVTPLPYDLPFLKFRKFREFREFIGAFYRAILDSILLSLVSTVARLFPVFSK